MLRKHQWSYVDSKDDSPVGSYHCVCCDKIIERITSVYVQVITQFIRQTIDQFDTVKGEFRRGIKYPSFKTGYCCKACYNSLYQVTYTDDKGKHRIIEALPWPIDHSIDRRSGMEATDRGKRSKDKITSVTDVVLLKHGEVVEEWKTSLPVTPNEPVDPVCYNYFMRGKR